MTEESMMRVEIEQLRAVAREYCTAVHVGTPSSASPSRPRMARRIHSARETPSVTAARDARRSSDAGSETSSRTSLRP